MITMHDAAQIDKYVGAVRLTLPRSFHLGLVDLLNRELKGLPARTGAAVKENIVAAVALVMQSSKTEEIYQAEAARLKEELGTAARVEAFFRLEEAKRRHHSAVQLIESAMFSRHETEKSLAKEVAVFLERTSSDLDAMLLREWLESIYQKRAKLYGNVH